MNVAARSTSVDVPRVDVLGVFAKFWQPGQVKTRLARSIGSEAAAGLYRAMLLTTLARLSHLGGRRTLVFTPAERRDNFATLEPVADGHWNLLPQTAGDLGARMAGFFADEFSRGADRVVLLGSDSPTVPAAFISRAFEMLRQHDVVLGPSRDGGYYLVGQSSPQSEMFSDINWSTTQVWPQTLARLDSRGARYSELQQWHDVDTSEDLRRLASEIDHTDRSLDLLREAIQAALAAGERRR